MMTALNSYTERLRFSLRQLLVIFLLLNASFLFAKPDTKAKIKHDSAAVELREPAKEKQEEIFKDEFWRYDRDKTLTKEEPNIFDRMWNSFTESLLDNMSSEKGGTKFWNIFWIVVLVLLIVFVIMKVTKSGTSSLFSGKKKTAEKIDASLEDVDIHAIDYDRMIADAVQKRDYRLAIRLWFLRSLKVLTDKELVHWKIDKTNSDYYYDLNGSDYQKEFGDVSFIYDYIWYGEKPVDESAYQIAQTQFLAFYTKIEKL